MIRVHQLYKNYGLFEALKGISFEAHDNEILGLLGPNGAGKTTAIRIITGILPATSGEVWIDDYEIHNAPDRVKRVLGYLPESVPLYMEMNVTDFLLFIGKIKGIHGKRLYQRLTYALEATKIEVFAKHPIRTLSKGYRQRVGIAQSIMNDPKYLILDEPTIGLDPNQIIEIRKLIHSLSTDRTIILCSHILTEISELCNKVVILNRGKMIASGTTEELRSQLKADKELLVSVVGRHQEALQVARQIPSVKEAYIDANGWIHIIMSDTLDIRSDLSQRLLTHGVSLLEIRKRELSLEDIFHQLTQEPSQDVA